MKEPKNIAIFLKDKLEPKIIGLSNEATNAVNKCYDWPEFYWIANYFNEDVWLMEIIENLLKCNQNFCHGLLIESEMRQEFRDKFTAAISKKDFHATEDNLVRKLLEPGVVFDTDRIRNLKS